MSQIPDFSDIIKAQSTLRNIVKVTPLESSKSFSMMSGAQVFMKMENLQSTGSFKVRGAYNMISALSAEELSNGVVCASAGNHAQGVAYSATRLGVKSTVFMPVFAPPLKVMATRSYGAEVVLTGDTFDDAFAAAMTFKEESGAYFIHPFNHPDIIAGQGTIGLEIFKQLDDVQDVVVPIGGGGLIAGIAIALKKFNPKIRIIGVEPEGAQSMKLSMEQGRVSSLSSLHTIADGIAVKTPGDLTLECVQKYVDELVVVSDAEISHALYLMLQRAKILAEPSGVASMAAILTHKIDVKGRKVVPVISGGNINMGTLEQIIEKGMMEEGMRVRLKVLTPDLAGELKQLITILDSIRANIHDIQHERSITTVPVGFVLITLTFNLQSIDQLQTIREAFDDKNLKYEVLS